MKRHAPRLAALAAALIAATAAQAQTNVTLYGRLDVTAETLRISGTTDRSASLLSNDGSRLGIRGSEDLGGGLRALFNLESGMAPDTGTITQGGIFWGRTSWVGVAKAGLGELRLGRNYIPMDDDAWLFDAFAAAGFGAHWALQPYAGRVNNSIKYISPTVSGFTGEALVSAGEGTAGGKQFGVTALYRSGKGFDAKIAHTTVKNAVPAGDRKEWLLAGSLRFGAPRVSVMHFMRDDEGATRLTSTVYGGNYTIGDGDVRLNWTNLEQGSQSTKRLAVGYWHNLSKRSSVYTAYARQTNSAGRNTTLNPSFIGLANGDDVVGFQVGMRHNF